MRRSLRLSCDAVSKAYGTRSLFDELSFGLFEGDRAGLVGPNGSGKSTLPQNPGRARAGRPGHALRPRQRPHRAVPQDPAFPAGGTVEDVIAAALAGADEGDRPGHIVLALGIAGFADGRADLDTLSGGWKKRLAARGAPVM